MTFLQDTNFWVLLSFTLFVVVALKFGRAKVLGSLDAKIEKIRNDINTAESLRIEAQELLAQVERKQRDANVEANTIIATAKASAEMIRKDAEADLDSMIARKEAQLADRLSRMEDSARAEIQAYAAELAVKATTEIITARLDQAANDRLIDKSIQSIAASLKS